MRYVLLFTSMLMAIAGQFFLKKGVLSSTLTPNIESVVRTLLSPYILFGFSFYGASSIIWLFVLQKFPLSVAYPALSLTYIAIVILSVVVLKESVSGMKIIGIILIVSGVSLIFK